MTDIKPFDPENRIDCIAANGFAVYAGHFDPADRAAVLARFEELFELQERNAKPIQLSEQPIDDWDEPNPRPRISPYSTDEEFDYLTTRGVML